MVTAEYDVLRDDGRIYAQKLLENKVSVIHKDFPGMIHGFFNYGTQIDEGYKLRDWISDSIRRVLTS